MTTKDKLHITIIVQVLGLIAMIPVVLVSMLTKIVGVCGVIATAESVLLTLVATLIWILPIADRVLDKHGK